MKGTVVVATPLRENRRRWSQRLQQTLTVREVTQRKALEWIMSSLKPDVLVIDLALLGPQRIRSLLDVQRLSSSTKIVAVTNRPTESEGVQALKTGVRGYCARTIDSRQLERAVAAVLKGDVWAARRLVPGLVADLLSMTDGGREESLRSRRDPRLENLTARQRVVADLVSKGACNKEIAHRLNITERTVKAHLTGTFRKVGVTDRLQLALLLKEHSGSA